MVTLTEKGGSSAILLMKNKNNDFFIFKGERVTEHRCTGRLHPFLRVKGVIKG